MRLIRLVFSLVLVAVLSALGWWALGPSAAEPSESVPAAVPSDRPPLPEDLSPVPLGSPGPVPDERGTLRFTSFQDDGQTPTAYDPCRQVHFVVANEALSPYPGVLQDAVAEISYRTGLQFVYDGATDEVPTPDDRSEYQPDRYGARWAPVLVAWSDPATYPGLDGPTTGLAGSTALSTDEPGSRRYVTGQAVFDSPQLSEMTEDEVRAVVLHELGHVVGLDHVSDQNELMYPDLLPGRTSFGPGDLHGLAQLGRGSCFTDF